MALAVQSSSSVASSTPWIQIPAPSGVVAGDILIAYAWLDDKGSIYSLNSPADWILLGSGGLPTSGFVRMWWKVAGSSEPTVYVFAGSGTSTGQGAICRINGVTGNLTFITSIATSANTANHAAPSVSTIDTDAIAVCFFGGVVNASSTWAVPAGFTNRGLGLTQSSYLQGIVSSKAFGAGFTGANVATSTAWNGVSLGDITATLELSQSTSLVSGVAATLGISSTVSAIIGGGLTLPASVKYRYDVDWTGNGNYTDSGDDVSSRVMANSDVTIEYGRDQARSLSPIKFGTAAFALNNISRDYYPDNSSGPLFGKLVTGRSNKITATFLGNDYVLWAGHLDDFLPDPTPGKRVLSVTCLDDLSKLDAKVYTQLYSGIKTGDAINYILDAIGFPTANRDIDPGYTIIQYWWEEGTNAWDAMNKIINSEGPPSFVTIDPTTGGIVFRDRMHRATRTASVTSQTTFRDAGADPRFSWPLGYNAGLRDIINSVSISVQQRAAQPPKAVWTTDATFTFVANEVKSIIATSTDPFILAQVPVAGTDYLVSGSVRASIGRSSGQSTLITLTEAAGSTATVTGLQLIATPLPVVNTTSVTASDSASIASFGLKPYPYTADWASTYDAAAIAALIIAQRAQRAPTVTVLLTGGNNTIMVQQLARDLSDRVTIVDAETGINADFHIEQIKHLIRGAGNRVHTTTLACEKIVSSLNNPASIFIFGSGTNGKFDTNTFGY